MVDPTDITATITTTCQAALAYADLGPGDDFFERGASSLTIVELQIQIEEKLRLQVPTSRLMATPTMSGWLEACLAAAAAARSAPDLGTGPLPGSRQTADCQTDKEHCNAGV